MSFLNLARSVHQAISIYTDTIDAAKVSYGDGLIKDSLRDGLRDGLIKDRFRGAVVGLWMVPMALFSTPRAISRTNSSDDSDRSCREKPGRDWFAGADNQETLSSAIAHHLDELYAFLCSPHRFRPPVTGPRHAFGSLPILLRYHSDTQRRSHALLESTTQREPKQAAQRLAQQLILGDVLSMAFGTTDSRASAFLPTKAFDLGQHRLSLTAAAMSELDASNYGLSSLQYRCYRDLWQSLEERVLQGTAASNSVVEGIAIALSWPNHYPTALQNARSYIQSTYIGRGDFVSALVESVIVTSVICGALGGRQSLPVLWQLQPYADQAQANSRYEDASGRIGSKPQKWQLRSAVELADWLFDRWAGITPRASHYNT